jgi:ABC-type branched-subunit amino acid transport system substrate-binding protein
MRKANLICGRAFVLAAAALWAIGAGLPAEAQAQAREIVIAQIAPFTGPQGPTGKGLRAGIQLYFDHVNATGGVNGASIKFISKDDGYRPEDTVRLFKETIANERPMAFIATVGTANIEALTKEHVLADANVALIGAASGASSMLTQPNVFVTKATHHDEVDTLFTILTTTGVNRVGVVYQDDPFGMDVVVGAEKAAAKTGVKIVVKAPYPRNTTDVKAAVEQVIKADPPTIYLVSITTATIEFIKEYRKRGGGAQLYGLSVNDGAAIVAKIGPELALGFAYGTVVPPSNARNFAVVREYLDLAARYKDKVPDLGGRSLEGYISAKVLVHALRKVKNPTPAAVVKAISSTSALDLGNYMIDFNDKGHTGSRFVDFAILDSRGRAIR